MLAQAAKLFIILGSANAMLAVILGAFGAHSMKQRLTDQSLAIFDTAVQYHFYHSLGLILVGLIATQLPSSGIKYSAWLMMGGIVLFSGSLYLLALSGIRQFGMITPLGGICFIAAWLTLMLSVYRN
jgi:uncharacterized membrane protein YgdD (TMEM256/DUF423 family)